MKKILLSILTIFLLALVAISVTANPFINPAVPSQTKDEDSAPWQLDLSAYENGDSGEGDLDLDWSISGVNTALYNTNFDVNLNIITFTPVANAYGSDLATLRLTSALNGSYVEQDITVTLNPVDDPAQWTATPSAQAVNEDTPAGTFVYTNIKSICSDIDSPITITASSTDTGHYTLYMLGDNLAIKDLEPHYNSEAKRVYVYCNGIQNSFFLTINSIPDAPYITSDIPSQYKQENSAPWALDLSAYEGSRDGETDLQLDWSVVGVNTLLFTANFDSNLNIITFSPVADAYGSDVITLTLTGLSGWVTQDITVTLAQEGAPLVVAQIPAQSWEKGTTNTIDLKNYFDPDSDVTYSVASAQPANINVAIASNGIVTLTPIDSSWTGTNSVRFRVTNTDGTAESNDVSLTVTSTPTEPTEPTRVGLCDVGEIGSLLEITEIEIDDDELKPGETLKVDVEVENKDSEDMKVIVEATLYNLDTNKKIISEKTEYIKINNDEKETFKLELPLDYDEENIGKDDNYKLRVKAYKSGDENEQCVESDDKTVSITREDDDVIIESYDMALINLKPGDTSSLTINVRNIGIEKQDDVYVKVREPILGIDLTSQKFDLDDYDGSDNTMTVSKIITIPSTVQPGLYQLEIIVYFNNGRDTASQFVSLTLLSGTAETSTQPQVTVEESKITGATTTTYTPVEEEGISYTDVLLVVGIVILVSLIGLFVKILYFPKKKI